MADYLTRKPGESIWYARMAVPQDVRPAFGGRAKLIKTTGTSNRADARAIAMLIAGQWKAEIKAVREMKAGNADEWRLAQHTVGLDLHEKRTKAINLLFTPPIPGSGSLSPSPSSVDLNHFLLMLLEIAKDLHAQGQHELLARLTSYSKRAVEVIESGSMSRSVGIELQAEYLSIIGDAEAAAIAEEYKLSAVEHQEAQEIVRNPSMYKPASPITNTRLAAFREHREKNDIALKTIDQQESKLKKLSQFLRTEGKSLSAETITAWLDTLDLSSKTKLQYLLAGNTFWQWANKHDSHWRQSFNGVQNPFKDIELPKIRGKAKADASRRAFTPDEIQRVYQRAKEIGKQELCDLIALGCYTGARIEELCQIKVESIITIEGVQCFDIRDSKTVAGIRQIPIHPLLLPFVDRLIKSTKDGFLLPSSSGNKYGNRSDPLSKAFGRLKTSMDFDRKIVFHCVRSMTITHLLRKHVPGPTVANIVGHETGLVTFDIYDEGASPMQKLEALKLLDFKLNG